MSIIQRQSQLAATIITTIGRNHAELLVKMAGRIESSLRQGGTFFACGNGGSAADAQHLAAELSGRFYLRRSGLAAIALTTNTSALTAIGNDFSYREIFSRQLDGIAGEGDVLLAISTSGGSDNILEAMAKARELDMTVLGMTGVAGVRFKEHCDLALIVPSEDTARIQEAHIFAGHMMCQLVETALFGSADV